MRSVVIAIAALLGTASAPAHAQIDPFLGFWRIAQVVATPDYAALPVAQARALVGRTIEVSRNRVQTWTRGDRQPQQDTCAAPQFLVTQSSRTRLLADYRLPPRDLSALPATFAEVTVTCRGNFVTVLRPAGANVLFTEIDSVFFRLERTNAPVPAPPGPTVGAPSFNCAQARRADELAICGDAGLARSDRQMADSFAKLLGALPEAQREALRREQRDWLANRAKQCSVTPDTRLTDANRAQLVRCLAGVYAARIQEIETQRQRATR